MQKIKKEKMQQSFSFQNYKKNNSPSSSSSSNNNSNKFNVFSNQLSINLLSNNSINKDDSLSQIQTESIHFQKKQIYK
jgi:hypothetical protein